MKRVFQLPGSRRRVDGVVDDELQFHLDERVEEIMALQGLSRDAATAEARRRFGDYDEHRRTATAIDRTILRRSRHMDLIETIRGEGRHAMRSLRRSPSFTLVAIVTLALGLGASTAIFTLLDCVVLRPLPYPNAGRLAHIGTLWPKVKEGEEYGISRGQYFYFKAHSRTLADIAFYDQDALVVPGDGTHPAERVRELDVSASTFAVFGIVPEVGHLFTAAQELNPGDDPGVALLSHSYWMTRFGGARTIVGRRIPYGAKTVEIIGVLPEGTALPDASADIWVPNHLDPSAPPINNHTHHGVGVLRPGVAPAAALADLARVQTQMQDQYPSVYGSAFLSRTGFAMTVTSLLDAIVGGDVVRAFWLLFAAVGLVLVIGAANVANLFLVRIDARRRESVLRGALGASRAHLAVHYLAESLSLTLVAAAVAVGLSQSLLRLMLAIAPQSLPRLAEVSLDWHGVAFCFGTALLFGIVFGLVPLGSASVDIAVLRDSGRGMTTSRRRDRARRALIVSQVAFAVVLLSGAALMVKSFGRLRAVKPGFEAAGVTTMSIGVPGSRYGNGAAVLAFWHQLLDNVQAIPGVERAGASGTLPIGDDGGCSSVLTDVTDPQRERGNCMPMTMVLPGYFETMGIVVHGETPTWSSVGSGSGPTVVTAAFAKRFWGDENPIGRGIKPFTDDYEYFRVVGVANDVRGRGLQSPPIEEAYFPAVAPTSKRSWDPWTRLYVVVRAPTMNTEAVAAAVRQSLARIDPLIPISEVRSMDEIVAASTAQTSFTMLLMLVSAGVALVLSAVGIYGVISYVIGQRRGEIGVRIALGAEVKQVVWLVLGQSLRVATAGVVIGLVAALIGTRFLQSLLFEVSPTDPGVLAGTAVVLLVVAALASAAPTRRAARIDPAESMRGS